MKCIQKIYGFHGLIHQIIEKGEMSRLRRKKKLQLSPAQKIATIYFNNLRVFLSLDPLKSYSSTCLLITLPYQHSKLALQEWTVHIRSRVKIASNPQPPPHPPRSELLGILIPPLVSAAHPPWIEASHLNSHTSVRLNFELRFLISYYRSSCCVRISGKDFTPNYLSKFKFHDEKLANPN